MLRRLIVVTALVAGMSIAAITLASPALAKGPSQARITGPRAGPRDRRLRRQHCIAGQAPPCRASSGRTSTGFTGSCLAHRIRNGHWRRSARPRRAGAALPQASHVRAVLRGAEEFRFCRSGPISGGYVRGNMNQGAVRPIMTIAHGVAAVVTTAGPGQFFWGPSRARARLASEARL